MAPLPAEITGAVAKIGCLCVISIFCFFIIFCLSFQNHKPKCYIVDFDYFPTVLNNQDNNNMSSTYSTSSSFLFFDLMLENVMPYNGLRYDNVNLIFSYSADKSSLVFLPIAHHTVPGFYQGMRRTAHKRDVATVRGLPALDSSAFRAGTNGSSSGVFRVDMATKVRSKQYFWYAKKHGLKVGGNIDMDGGSKKGHKMAIRLR